MLNRVHRRVNAINPAALENTALSDMWHLSFLILFMFLISSIHHHHPALLHHHTLIMDSLLTFLIAFSTLVFKLSFLARHASVRTNLRAILFFIF